MVPRYIGIYLNKDNFYPGFNGLLKYWYFAGGKGAFKVDNYEALANKVDPEDIGNEKLYSS